MKPPRNPTPKQQSGQQAEFLAQQLLTRHGLVICDNNFHCKVGEIDLIMKEEETLVFVEVRHRTDTTLGSPLESITPAKQTKIRRTAQYYLQQKFADHWPPCRFDAIGITGELEADPNIEWIKHAFF